MSHGTLPIPYWMSDRDYYPRGDPRRAEHLKHIDIQDRINARIDACAGDRSYAVLVHKSEVV